MTAPDYEKSIIALCCWRQGKAELYRGMLSVAMAIRNRAKTGWFEGSIYKNAVAVLVENPSNTEFPDARDPQFQDLMQAVDGVYDDRIADKTDGALYWISAQSAEQISGVTTCQVGQIIFFK